MSEFTTYEDYKALKEADKKDYKEALFENCVELNGEDVKEEKFDPISIIGIITGLISAAMKLPGLVSFVFQLLKWGIEMLTIVIKWGLKHIGDALQMLIEAVKKWIGEKTVQAFLGSN